VAAGLSFSSLALVRATRCVAIFSTVDRFPFFVGRFVSLWFPDTYLSLLILVWRGRRTNLFTFRICVIGSLNNAPGFWGFVSIIVAERDDP
jgi:hypothetical protein